MGLVFRRSMIKAAGAAAVSATLGACSTDDQPATAVKTPATSAAGSPAGSPAASPTAPANPKTFAVRDLKLSRGASRPLPTRLWVPNGDGPFPLIVFSHGLSARPAEYANILTPWARAGFVVAAPTFPHTAAGSADFNVLDVINQPADVSYVIGQVLSACAGRIDAKRIAAAGHSAGGVTTIGLFSSSRDSRLVSGVVLAGTRILAVPFTGAAAPLLFVHGKRDRTVPYADGRAAYDAVTWPKAFLTITGGGHVTTGASLDVVIATTTDFWRWSLYGDETARARLPKDATKGHLATLDNKLS